MAVRPKFAAGITSQLCYRTNYVSRSVHNFHCWMINFGCNEVTNYNIKFSRRRHVSNYWSREKLTELTVCKN
jgi:hypothetical protein